METVLKRGQTVHSTTVSTSKAESTVEDSFIGPMVQIMTDISLRMTLMVMVTIDGAITVNTRVNGAEIRCMEQAFSLPVMAKLMKELTSMIKRLVTVFSSGLMGTCMMVNSMRGVECKLDIGIFVMDLTFVHGWCMIFLFTVLGTVCEAGTITALSF